ncbi:uncharacterized protein LOC113097373 isoform X1 [Carassius auratus]|uniref:Uncharacterized protein LOC113097373 isoform X1 n=1 Tax=Carassius auratus TaxID=7957 RepID=A0A6P6PBH4_CARAU|nr:uncharacterized protein LOC113097373 isoform X1 [Carassius auratus]
MPISCHQCFRNLPPVIMNMYWYNACDGNLLIACFCSHLLSPKKNSLADSKEPGFLNGLFSYCSALLMRILRCFQSNSNLSTSFHNDHAPRNQNSLPTSFMVCLAHWACGLDG